MRSARGRPVARAQAALAALLAPIAAVTLTGAGQTGQAPDDVARSLQQRYETVRDFSADFVQTYEGGVLRRKVSERGTVLIKKPGKMRWTYASPEEKVFVSDGIKLYSYVKADRQVIVSDAPARDGATTAVLFLAGTGNLPRDFTPSLIEPPPDRSSHALKLVPRTRQPEYEALVLVVDRASLELRQVRTIDGQGGTSTLAFTNLKENVGLSDKQFVFTIPRGVDVISQGVDGRR